MRILQLLLPFILSGVMLAGEEPKPKSRKQSLLEAAEPQRVDSRPAVLKQVPKREGSSSLTQVEAFGRFSIAAGKSLIVDSTSDWTGADKVSIGFSCPSSTSLKTFQVIVWWTVNLSLAQLYTASDVIFGSDFVFQNTGGGVTPAFGQILRLEMRNAGTADINCEQITLYSVVVR
jgi:hypothetical protein